MHTLLTSLAFCVTSVVLVVTASDATCSVAGCSNVPACHLQHVFDWSDQAAIAKHFSGNAVQEPALIRGATANWVISKIAETGWGPLKESLTKKFGNEKIGYKTSAEVAQFGGWSADFRKIFSLKEYINRIEDGRDAFFAFEARSDLGQKLYKSGLWSLDHVAENGHFKPFGDRPVISIGGDGDGLPFHIHSESVLGLVAGMKQWLLMAPGDMTEDVLGDSFNVTRYMDRLLTAEAGEQSWPKGMIYCEQRVGDVLVVPFNWWHATKNIGITIGFGGQWDFIDAASDDKRLVSSVAPADVYQRVAETLNQKKTPYSIAEAIAELMEAFDKLPSMLSIAYQMIVTLHEAKHPIAGSAIMRRVLWHLQSLEKRGGIDDESLGALFAHFGECAIKVLHDASIALDLLTESLRLDPENPAAWYHSAFAIQHLPDVRLHHHNIKKKNQKKEVTKRLKKSLEINPDYEPAREALERSAEWN